MASPGDNLRKVWTADFYNRLCQLLSTNGPGITVSGRGVAANGRRGTSIVITDRPNPLSTIQGLLSGGSAISVSDGTVIVDPYAWGGYSVQAAYFKTTAGSTNITVLVNATPVSWLTSIPVNSSGKLVTIPNPVTDLTHVIYPADSLSIQISGSSSDCAGLQFSLNCPF